MVYQHCNERKLPVFCANCGGFGHIYKTCNHPITSYGIICFKLCYNKDNNTISPKYLMVQRKDSLSYVEFLRGKYELSNRQYLYKLFTNMTCDERRKVKEQDFDSLWKEMWCKSSVQENNKNFCKEYQESKDKFELLKKGIYIKTVNNEIHFFDVNHIIDNTTSEFDETEWGFPKGRRNINEDDIACAVREFREETGLNSRNIKICESIKPFEEVFSGTNKVRYKHVYYVAKFQNLPFCNNKDAPMPIPNNVEIKDIKWFDYIEAQSKIRNTNVERRELFKRLNAMVVKSIR